MYDGELYSWQHIRVGMVLFSMDDKSMDASQYLHLARKFKEHQSSE